jgi:hypothetical protein
MNRGLLGRGALVLVLATAGPLWAQSPMSPSRPLGGAGAAKQWVEPPAADKSDTTSATAADSARPAEKPQASEAQDHRRPRSSQRSAARSGSTASRLNRQELARVRSGAGAYYPRYYSGSSYYGYYGPRAYSSGN